MLETLPLKLAQKLAERFSQFSAVQAVGLAGSQTSGAAVDLTSDIDLYVYTNALIPLAERTALVQQSGAGRADLNLQFWDLGDEWFDAETGIEVDVIYWETPWITEMLDRVLVHHAANVGYTTCFWHTLRNTRVLYDPGGWLQRQIMRTQQPYPEALRRAIIAKNYPVLRQVIPGYAHQIEKAVRRGDLVSVNHRVAALLASYFEVIFALNRVLNPGEKRLLSYTLQHCPRIPPEMAAEVTAVLQAAGACDPILLEKVAALLDHLDPLLRDEGF
jgi:hypothetical protein